MLTGTRSGYWVVQWSDDWDPSLADLLCELPEVVLGRRVAITSCDSGPYKPTEVELTSGWSIYNAIALSPAVETTSDLPTPGFDEWYVFDGNPEIYPGRNFVNRYEFSPLTTGEEVDLFWSQIEATRPMHVLGAGTPNMFLVTRDKDTFERAKRFNSSLNRDGDSAAAL